MSLNDGRPSWQLPFLSASVPDFHRAGWLVACLSSDLGLLRFTAFNAAGDRASSAGKLTASERLAKLRGHATKLGLAVRFVAYNAPVAEALAAGLAMRFERDNDPVAEALAAGLDPRFEWDNAPDLSAGSKSARVLDMEFVPDPEPLDARANHQRLIAAAAEFVSDWRLYGGPNYDSLLEAGHALAGTRIPGFPARQAGRVAASMVELLAALGLEIADDLEGRPGMRPLIELADEVEDANARRLEAVVNGAIEPNPYMPTEEHPLFAAAAERVDADDLAAWLSQKLHDFNEEEAEVEAYAEFARFQLACGRLALRGPVDETSPRPPAEDDSAYRPASELRHASPPPLTHKQLMLALERNPWIRRRKPSKQRLCIHAGDWSRYVAILNKASFDALDVTAETEDAFLAEVSRRQEEVRLGKIGK